MGRKLALRQAQNRVALVRRSAPDRDIMKKGRRNAGLLRLG
jgi:hypothetical protein